MVVINDVPGPSILPVSGRHGNVPFVSTKLGRSPWQMKLTDEQGRARYPFLILDSVRWHGPIVTEEEQKHRDELTLPKSASTEEMRLVLGRLAKRAFRRPVGTEEIDAFVGLAQREMAAGEKFPDAMKSAMAAILCSKSFIFLSEGDPTRLRHTLNDWEIASRLSYLLWSTMPDEQLFSLAEAGKLHDKTELARQVDRMLADPRSGQFVDSFATQWLRCAKSACSRRTKSCIPITTRTSNMA